MHRSSRIRHRAATLLEPIVKCLNVPICSRLRRHRSRMLLRCLWRSELPSEWLLRPSQRQLLRLTLGVSSRRLRRCQLAQLQFWHFVRISRR